MARVPTVAWRGVIVSRDMVAPLDELAASVRPWVSPIPGYGSYRGNKASGGTDAGSGHLDIYCRTGWTQPDRDLFVANGRRMGLAVFERPQRWWSPTRGRWLTEKWAWHFHLLLKDSADLSPAAREQLRRWYAGSNGLAGNDPDTGPRTHLRQTWSQYLASKKPTVPATSPPVKTPPAAPPKDWFDMATAKDLETVVRRYSLTEQDVRRIVRQELNNSETARHVHTTGGVVKDARTSDPDAPRVSASTLLEDVVSTARRIEAAVAGSDGTQEPDPGEPPPVIAPAPDPEPDPAAKSGPAFGIDVGKDQSADLVTRSAADEGYEFVIVNATIGLHSASSALDRNTRIARASGDLVGFYHWSQTVNQSAKTPDKSDPIGEAKWHLERVNPQIGDILSLDHEEELGTWAQRVAYAISWLDYVAEQTGARPLLYANGDWLWNLWTAATPQQRARLFAYPLWFAWPARPGVYAPLGHKYSPATYGLTPIVHQYSITGGIDRNWTPDLAALRALGVTRAQA